MCGRFASSLPPEAIRALFRTTNPLPNIAPNWNVAPSQAAMVIRRHPETGERQLDLLRWGLIPSFAQQRPRTAGPSRRPGRAATQPRASGR